MELTSDPSGWPLWLAIIVFSCAAGGILFAGIRVVVVADTLADRTGLGEAFYGGVFLGAMTSVADFTTCVTAAWNGYAELAVASALGGIAIQTLFLVAADFAYRRANLEHAAASAENLLYATLLVVLITIPLTASLLPPVTWGHVHPASVIMLIAYGYGLRLVYVTHTGPMWRPLRTRDTRKDLPEPEKFPHSSTLSLWLRFAVFGGILALSGWMTAKSGEAIAHSTGLSETVVGAFLTGIATSLPELVTATIAVRQGALTMAVGNIMGGNTFDVLLVGFSDMAYRDGSIFHLVGQRSSFLLVWNQLLTGILLMGMLSRQRHGVANIGFEGGLIIVVYFGGAVLNYLLS